jgi:hypothetical protein
MIQYKGALSKRSLAELSAELGVTPAALRALHVGLCFTARGPRFTFPEFDGQGRVVGIATRAPDGSKKVIAGSKRGVYLPLGWRDRPSPILIVEGASDCAALTPMGLAAIGRPSATGGVDYLAEALANISDNRLIVVVGELDAKSDGRWPGREAAEKVARQLAAQLGRPVRWALPPDQAKDTREWLRRQREVGHVE